MLTKEKAIKLGMGIGDWGLNYFNVFEKNRFSFADNKKVSNGIIIYIINY